jgi:tRNA(adenine34) deaminase
MRADTLTDERYMQYALLQAQRAAERDEVPVGAVLVDARGDVVARAYNQTVSRCSPLAHAESLVIQRAAKKLGDWRLDTHTLYVTLEPCALCMHLIIMSRIVRVVYGASSPLYGFSVDNYCMFVSERMPLVINKGVCAKEVTRVMKTFFQKKRRRLNGTEAVD